MVVRYLGKMMPITSLTSDVSFWYGTFGRGLTLLGYEVSQTFIKEHGKI